MTETQKEEIQKSIQKYTDYLNNGEQKPDWRIKEVNNYITVMKRVLSNDN